MVSITSKVKTVRGKSYAVIIKPLLLVLLGFIAGRASVGPVSFDATLPTIGHVDSPPSTVEPGPTSGTPDLSSNSAGSTLSVGASANFAAHVEAMEYAIRPGRGYKPTGRQNAPLPEVVGSYWWMDQTVPESFSFSELDMTYDKQYFRGGHPKNRRETYTTYVHEITSMFFPGQRETASLVEFGNGGGYFASKFHDRYGSNFFTVEGTGAGVAETLEQWKVPQSQVIQHDLRNPLYLGRRFDVAACTEVVEHVEPPFSSQIALTLVLHADVIWFSFKPLGLNNKAWINHPNERPLKMWKNLFDFFGYDLVLLPARVKRAVAIRGDLVAYKRENDLLKIPTMEMIEEKAKYLETLTLDGANTHKMGD